MSGWEASVLGEAWRKGSLAVVLVIGLLLGACGAPSGERPLGEEDYLLELTGSLPVSDFDPGATFWAYSLESRPGEGVYSTAYEPGFAVDTSTGGYAVSVDARSLATAALTPEALIGWYYRDYDGEGFTVSNPDARIQVIGWVELHQRVPTGDGWHYSHDIKMIERYMDGETERRASGFPMFSDAPVRIEGQVTPPGAGSPLRLEIELVPGWNLVSSRYQDGSWRWKARPITDQPHVVRRAQAWLAQLSQGETVAGEHHFSLFAARDVHDGVAEGGLAWGELYDGTSGIIYAPRWFPAATPALKELTAAFPGEVVSGSIESSDPDARGLLGMLVMYPPDATDAPAWWDDPGLSDQVVTLRSETSGNEVLLLYADRPTSLDVTDLVLDLGGGATTGPLRATGLALQPGWNWVEAVPGGEAGLRVLTVTYDVPYWLTGPR